MNCGAWGLFYPFPQVLDVDPDEIRAPGVGWIIPDLVEQAGRGEDFPRVAHQVIEQVELDRGEADPGLARGGQLVGPGVQGETRGRPGSGRRGRSSGAFLRLDQVFWAGQRAGGDGFLPESSRSGWAASWVPVVGSPARARSARPG